MDDIIVHEQSDHCESLQIQESPEAEPAGSYDSHDQFADNGNDEELAEPFARKHVSVYNLKLEGGEMQCWIQRLSTDVGFAYSTVCAGGEPSRPDAMLNKDWNSNFFEFMASVFEEA